MSLEVLGPRACRRLLDQVSVAWLAHCVDGAVHMVPVNFTVHGDEIVVRSGYGRSLTAVVEGRPITVAAGHFDEESRTGWSVTVTGRAHLVGDPLVNPGAPAAEVWAELPATVPVAVAMTTVTGRRVR